MVGSSEVRSVHNLVHNIVFNVSVRLELVPLGVLEPEHASHQIIVLL